MKNLIERLIDECEEQGHEHERLSADILEDLIDAGDRGVGILTLVVGVANMGVDIPIEVPDVDRFGEPFQVYDFSDPAGRDWMGKPAGYGKHMTDWEVGGLLLPHIDGSALDDVYEMFAGDVCEATLRAWRKKKYHFRLCRYDTWRRWASNLVKNRRVLRWAIEWWLDEYWERPAVKCATTVEARVMRARVANSRPGWLRSMPSAYGFDQVARMYVEMKAAEGETSERASAKYRRAQRQVRYCRRVTMLIRRMQR
jgi:hypothetical protein